MKEFYWFPSTRTSDDVFGPFDTKEAAIKHATESFPNPPREGKSQYAVGCLILQVVEQGEVIVTTKGEWVS